MSTKFLSPGWRMPRNANQSKSFNYSFTGAGQVDIASPAEVGITSSYSWWMNRNSATANTAYFYNVVGTAGYGMYFLNSSLIYLRYGDGATYIVLSSTELTNAILQINVWQNWTITRKQVSATAQDIKLYVDGVKVVEVLNTTGLGTLGSSVKQVFGAGSIIKMLDFSVFDYVLSDGAISVGGTATGQVAELYNSGNPINPMALPSPPIAYYPLGTSAYNGEYLAENNAIGDYVFDFDGSNYIDLGDDDVFNFSDGSTNLPFSISAWIKITGTTSQGIVTKYGGTASTNEWIYYTTGGKLRLLFASIGFATSTTTLSTNTWYHVVSTYNGQLTNNGINLYINGVQETVTYGGSGSSPIVNTSQPVEIGRHFTTSGSNYLNGKMSNVQIWNKELIDSEVETLYNYGSPIQTLANIPQNSNLKAWYKLDASEVYNSTTTEWSIDNNQNPSAYSSSLDFNGSSDYIDCGDNDDFSFGNGSTDSPFSVSAWVNFSDVTNSSLFSKTNVAPNFWEYSVHIQSDEKIYFGLYGQGDVSGSNYIFVGSTATLTSYEGSWINLTFTYDGSGSVSGLKIYLNESEISTTTFENGTYEAMVNTAAPFKIGRSFNNRHLNGSISNVSVWNTELTSSQVSEIYNNGTPSNLSSHSATSNLVSWYKLNNTTTGIEDAKGSNNGTNNGATEYTGFVNKLVGDSSGMTQANLVQSDLQTVAPYSKYALDFDGTDDYIDCGTPSTFAFGTGDFTISGWVYLDLSTNYQWLFSTGTNFAFGFDSSRNLQLWVAGTATTPSFNINLNQWHHIVATRNSGTVTFYIDGSAFGTTYSRTGSIGAGSYNYIGTFNVNQNNLNGKLSNASIWNAALTSAQVTELYNQGLPSNLNSHSAYSNLVSWWQLGENSSFDGNDWIVADEKGTNNGTSVSMPVGALVNGVGTTANGVSSGMSEGNLVGDAPYSTANAISTNMIVTSRVTGSGNTP